MRETFNNEGMQMMKGGEKGGVREGKQYDTVRKVKKGEKQGKEDGTTMSTISYIHLTTFF